MDSDSANGVLLIDSKEVAKILGVSSSTIWRMRCANQLPPPIFVCRRLVKWKRSDIMAWIDQQMKSPQ